MRSTKVLLQTLIDSLKITSLVVIIIYVPVEPVSAAVISNFLVDDVEENAWHGYFDAGADLRTGESELRTIEINAEWEKSTTDSRWELEFEYYYDKEKKEDDQKYIKSADEIEFSSEYNMFFTEDSYVWFLQAASTDRVDGLDLGIDLGVGLGHEFYSRGRLRKTQYNIEGGLYYSRSDNKFEADDPDNDSSQSGLVISHDFIYKIRRGIVFQHELEIIEFLDPQKFTVIEMENELAVSLYKDMFLRLSLETEWEEKKPNDSEKEPTQHQLVISAGWRF